MSNTPENSIRRGTATVAILTLGSRILGFAREALTARLLGATFLSDAYYIALRIPNLCRSILAEGAFTSAFVPLFNASLTESKEEAESFLNTSAVIITIVASLVTLGGIIYAHELVEFFAPGLPEHAQATAENLTQIVFPFVILITLTSLLGSVLTSLKIFGTASWAQIVLNFTLIAGALLAFFFDSSRAAVILAQSTVVGGLIGVLFQLPLVHKKGFFLINSLKVSGRLAKKLIFLMIPALLTSSVYQLSIFISTIIASCVGEGTVSILFYSDRISQLPLGIFSISLGTVLLPSLSSAYAKKDYPHFSRLLSSGLSSSCAALIPLCTFMAMMSYSLCTVVFRGGAFTEESALATSAVLKIMSVSVFFSGLQTILSRGFLATLNTKVPAFTSALSLCMTLGSTLMFLPQLRGDGSIVFLLTSIQQILPHITTGLTGASTLALGSLCGSMSSILLLIVTAVWLKIPCAWSGVGESLIKNLTVSLFAILPLLFINIEHTLIGVVLHTTLFVAFLIIGAYIFKAKEILELFLSTKRYIKR